MRNWYYTLLGEEFGPYAQLELCAVFQKRKLDWDTIVRSDDAVPIPASEVGWLVSTVKQANYKGEDLDRKLRQKKNELAAANKAKAKKLAQENEANAKKLAEEKVRAGEASERKLASRPKVENFEKVSLQTEVPRKSPSVQMLGGFLTLIVIFSVVIPTVIAVFNEREWGEAVINIVVTALPTVGSISILLYLASVLHDIRYFLAEQTAEIKSSQKK